MDRTDHQTNFPTAVSETFSSLVLHACAQKMRIPQPLGGAVGSPGVGAGGIFSGVSRIWKGAIFQFKMIWNQFDS